MNLDIYDSIHRSVDGIIAYLDQESDVVQGLDKLYNGGWVSDTQLLVVRSKLGMKVDKPQCQRHDRFQEEEEDYQEEEEVPAQAWTWTDDDWTVSRDTTISSRRDQENGQRGCGTSWLRDAEEGDQEAQEVSLQEQQFKSFSTTALPSPRELVVLVR